MRLRSDLARQIQSVKFFPPQVTSSQFLYRKRIVDQLLSTSGQRVPTILIEAQAGQGKTTTIKQFLDRTALPSIWYQLGPEDVDPTLFIESLTACIGHHVPNFPSVTTQQHLTESDYTLLTIQQRVTLLFNDLDTNLNDDLYMVIDDLHYLTPYNSHQELIDSLIENAPKKLHLILVSREPLFLTNETLTSVRRKLIRLGNHDLALDENEVSDFFQQSFRCEISQEDSQRIAHATDGWVMGILLIARHMKHNSETCEQCFPDNFKATSRHELYHYFRDEIFSHFDERLHRPLLLLSLLKIIPVELAVKITGDATIGDDLHKLALRNFFIRHLDSNNAVFGLHHLFQQFLQEKATTELTTETICQAYQCAGQFWQQQDNPAPALRYFVRAHNRDAIEAHLQNTGMDFLAQNQTTTLATILQEIPTDELAKQGWSSLFLALSTLDTAPAQALPLLNQALKFFSTQHDEIGELHCLAHIISIHITTTGHYRDGEELLERAEQLFFQTATDLNPSQTILITRSLAMGHCILRADTDQATQFGSLALNLASKENLVNFEAALLMMMGYIQIFAGHTSLALMYLEQAAPYVHHPEVGSFNRLSIRMMLFNFLFNDGDFKNYFEQKNQLIESIGSHIVSQSIAGPFCYVWEMDIAINQGNFDQALKLSTQALAQDPPLSPHLLSLVLQQQGLALAIQQHSQQALKIAEQSQQQRDLSGGPFFIVLNKIVVGLTYCYCQRYDHALTLLDEAIDTAKQIPTKYLEATGLLHRGLTYLEIDDEKQAKKDIAKGLELMRHNSYRHIWAWTPAAIQKTLCFAATHNIETSYARTLAEHHLNSGLLDNGSIIPLLEIRTLGCFTVLCQGETILQAEDLTPTQREMLCLLIASPNFKISQEKIQLYFWPESSADAAKIKLDTLISRLRKTLIQALPEEVSHHYLKREKGVVWLASCRIDAHDFLNHANQGLRHFRLQENWQASNDFHSAHSLWQGEFGLGVSGEDQIHAFRQQLANTHSEIAQTWGHLLMDCDRSATAIKLVEKALIHDPINDRLFALLYQLQGKRSTVQARRVLERFKKILQQEGYCDEEINEQISTISTPS